MTVKRAGILLGLAVAGCGSAPSGPPALERQEAPGYGIAQLSPGPVVITNPGSTNLAPYRIVVQASGEATYVNGSRSGTGRLPRALVDRYYADVRAASPLSGLPRITCVKSASFGTSTYLEMGGQTSPDISCPGDAREQTLYADVLDIARNLGVSNYPRRTVFPGATTSLDRS